MEASQEAGTGPRVVFGDGYVEVDGIKIPLPKRPESKDLGFVYDVLGLIGMVAAVALTVAQLIVLGKK